MKPFKNNKLICRYHNAVSYLDTSKEKRDSGSELRRYMWRGLSPFQRIFKKRTPSLEKFYPSNDPSEWENDWIRIGFKDAENKKHIVLPETYKASDTLIRRGNV